MEGVRLGLRLGGDGGGGGGFVAVVGEDVSGFVEFFVEFLFKLCRSRSYIYQPMNIAQTDREGKE